MAKEPIDKEKLLEALKSLDPANPDHWTENGSPAMTAVEAAYGANITRKEVTAVAPTFHRENPSFEPPVDPVEGEGAQEGEKTAPEAPVDPVEGDSAEDAGKDDHNPPADEDEGKAPAQDDAELEESNDLSLLAKQIAHWEFLRDKQTPVLGEAQRKMDEIIRELDRLYVKRDQVSPTDNLMSEIKRYQLRETQRLMAAAAQKEHINKVLKDSGIGAPSALDTALGNKRGAGAVQAPKTKA